MVQTRQQARSATPDPKSIPITADTVSAENAAAIKKPDFGQKPKKKTKLGDSYDGPIFGVVDFLRIVAGTILFSCMMSYFIIGDSLVWGQDKVFRKYYKGLKRNWTTPVYLNETTLSLYNGTDPELPIYLSINGTIYDVTEGRSKYGPGGSYSFFGMWYPNTSIRNCNIDY